MGEDTAAQHALLVTQITDGKWSQKHVPGVTIKKCSILTKTISVMKILQGSGSRPPARVCVLVEKKTGNEGNKFVSCRLQ